MFLFNHSQELFQLILIFIIDPQNVLINFLTNSITLIKSHLINS